MGMSNNKISDVGINIAEKRLSFGMWQICFGDRLSHMNMDLLSCR